MHAKRVNINIDVLQVNNYNNSIMNDYQIKPFIMKLKLIPEPGRKPGARVTNSARLFTPGEKDSIADSKVVVIVGWVVISLISKIQRITGV